MWEVDREWYQAAKTLHFGLRLLAGLLIFLFFTALFVDSAYAAVVQSPYDGVVWGIGVVENPNGSSMESYNPIEGCIVNAPNSFSAACFAVGGNPATLTSDQKALLSNASTGGDFYTFCQNFANYGGSFDSPDDWYVPKFYDVWHMLENLYGDDLYAATFTSAQLRGAKADYQLVLDGGSLGGGGGGEVGSGELDGEYGALYHGTLPQYVQLNVIDGTYSGSYDGSLASVELIGYANCPHVSSYTYVYAWINQIAGRYTNTGVILANAPIIDRTHVDTKDYYIFTKDGSPFVMYETQTVINSNGGILGRVDVSGSGRYMTGALSGTNPLAFNYFACNDALEVVQPIPPTNWPDNPTVTPPEPPEIPNPYNPIIDEQPIDPTPPQNPIFPPILSITEETYTVDLQGILDAMDAHCQHLRSALHTDMSNLWTVLSTKMTNDFSTFRTYMTGQIGWLGDLISDELEATRDYMQDLAEWLADQIDFSFTGMAYDDNTLISWLRKIYYRLGSGGVNTRPTDPVANPVDAGDWLSQLIANLFSALNALAGGLLTSVGSALDLMHTKFPFSLPWDLLAILALFEATPTAPDFDVPIYTVSSVGQLLQVGTWEIDLSGLSPYLEGIRWMQKICFVYFLAVHTKDWMDTLEKVVA